MNNMQEHNYLKNIPNSAQEYGLAKVLLVRSELIHLKHIFTELFCRKSVPLDKMLDKIGISLMDYMEIMTHRMRRITKLNRMFQVEDINSFTKDDNHFFSTLEILQRQLNCCVVLDFDGVITKANFRQLYELIIERANKVVICSANPAVKNDWFNDYKLSIPNRIIACKGKVKKIVQLIELSKRYDFCLYIDNEAEYLDYAWIFGIKTYHYRNGKICYYTRKTK